MLSYPKEIEESAFYLVTDPFGMPYEPVKDHAWMAGNSVETDKVRT